MVAIFCAKLLSGRIFEITPFQRFLSRILYRVKVSSPITQLFLKTLKKTGRFQLALMLSHLNNKLGINDNWPSWPVFIMDSCLPLFELTYTLCQILSLHYVYTITTNQSTVNISGRMTFMKRISDDTTHFTLCIINNIVLKPAAQSSNTFI